MERDLAENQINLCFKLLESMAVGLEVISAVTLHWASSSYLAPNEYLSMELNTDSEMAVVAQKMVILAFAVQA